MLVKIKKVAKGAVMPTKVHATDAGFDLYCTSTEVNWGTRKLTCHTGLAFEIPDGYVGLIFPRSSVSNKPLEQKTKRVGWMNVCKYGDNQHFSLVGGVIHPTREQALTERPDYIVDTIQIKWEEK